MVGKTSSSSDRVPQGKVIIPPQIARAGLCPIPTPSYTLQVLGGLLWRAAHPAFLSTSLSCLLPTSQCPSKTFGTFSSTKDFPDDVIQFARNHPLMYNSVLPIGGRPLFQQVGAGYTFTQITADRVAAADGYYDVLFIGTGQGRHDHLQNPAQALWPVSGISLCSDPFPYVSWGCVPHLLLDAALIASTHILHLSSRAAGGGIRSKETPGPSCQRAQGVTPSSHPYRCRHSAEGDLRPQGRLAKC